MEMFKLSQLPMTNDVTESAKAVRTVKSSAIAQISFSNKRKCKLGEYLPAFCKMGVKISLLAFHTDERKDLVSCKHKNGNSD